MDNSELRKSGARYYNLFAIAAAVAVAAATATATAKLITYSQTKAKISKK